MPEEPTNELYDKVVRISKTYLGPAAERFIYRQVKNHLDKEPADLHLEDMSVLTDWIRISVSFLTEDMDVVEEYAHQLKKLADSESEAK